MDFFFLLCFVPSALGDEVITLNMIKSAPVGPVAGGIMGCIMVLVLAVYAYRHQIHRRSHQHMSPLAAQGELRTLGREIVVGGLKTNKHKTTTKRQKQIKINPKPLLLFSLGCLTPFYVLFAEPLGRSDPIQDACVLAALSWVQPDLLLLKESLPESLQSAVLFRKLKLGSF